MTLSVLRGRGVLRVCSVVVARVRWLSSRIELEFRLLVFVLAVSVGRIVLGVGVVGTVRLFVGVRLNVTVRSLVALGRVGAFVVVLFSWVVLCVCIVVL